MGELNIVGIGPGNYENMTVLADETLKNADVIAGYSVYVNLAKKIYTDKEFLTTPMTKEVQRCKIALERAAAGENVALICSGDAGIYGMAALAHELRGNEKEPQINVVPGLTAAASGAALLGAPLTDDFAVISLSDRLTPFEKIVNRLKLAAQADLCIVLYNPASRSRSDYLLKACDILLEFLPPERICGVCSNIGRQGEKAQIMSLKNLRTFPADMFCTVFIGNEKTKKINGKMVTPRGYKNV